ncbi:MAG: Large, multifunctional secreted protein [Verrucomicrobiales bacterium]|nr:Large, multifunctional secreted protein [Verrucomicrobiales bacterium]
MATTFADDAVKPAKSGKPVRHKKWAPKGDLDQDFPFQGACISAGFPANNTAMKGLAIKLDHNASVLFDTDLLRYAAAWTNGFLTIDGVAFSGSHGNHPSIVGAQQWGTKPTPGVADEASNFKDTRPEPFGPIDATLGRWDGLYVQGDDVILSYTVQGTKILEKPSAVAAEGQLAFVRNIQIEKAQKAFSIVVCDTDATSSRTEGDQIIFSAQSDLVVSLVGAPKGVSLKIDNQRLVLNVAAKTSASNFKIVLWNGYEIDRPKFAALAAGAPEKINLKESGPARWTEAVETKGVLDFSKTPDGAYVVDQLTPPQENPWKRRVRFSGMDFFSDGKRAALSTWDGDIWIVSGIDANLEKLTWKRFSSGMYETLGLKIVNDVIYTAGRDQITRYHDLNNDGEADYYENFCNLFASSDGFHEFQFDLQADNDGNFYTMKAGPVRPGGAGFGGPGAGTVTRHAGCLLKISKDGRRMDIVATGFRAPNGISVGPNGQLTSSDNEGTWVPSTPIHFIQPGHFHGVQSTTHDISLTNYVKPACWLSHADFDNSGGEQVWVTSKNWGMPTGDLLHMSYGKCSLFRVLTEKIGEQWQAACVRLPLKFTSSAMRGRFNAKDGQLYICGLQGWQTSAAKLAGFDRVRYTGKSAYSIDALHVKNNGLDLHFTQPLDPSSANDVQNYTIKRWNYDYAEHYGSPEFSVASAGQKGRDDVTIKSAKVSADGKTVFLEIDDVRPVMQESITYDLLAKDGTQIKQDIQHTINAVPAADLTKK